MPARTAFVYSDRFGSYHYGSAHPMKPVRLRLTYELMEALGLARLPNARFIEARKATEKELLLFHTPEYLRVLKEANTGIIPVEGSAHGLGYGDNPVFNGMYDWSCLSAGASLQASEIIARKEAEIAFNIAGGLHHAMPARASGFCYINDPAVAIKYLVGLGKRVAYVDIDAHHGDGVEYAFYDTNRVLTISLHESGSWLFPGTGFVTDTGVGEGRGYSVNLPFPPGTYDELFTRGFSEIVPAFIEAYSPDVLVTQLGVDTFDTDPITHLSLSTNGFESMIRQLRAFSIPWVALGGGGYDLSNVARAWTLAWATMNSTNAANAMPRDFLERNSDIFASPFLRDKAPKTVPLAKKDVAQVEAHIMYLKKEVLPLVKSR